ncbi:MAG: tetratricopeptide repeat protein [Phycisphaerae bacterium]
MQHGRASHFRIPMLITCLLVTFCHPAMGQEKPSNADPDQRTNAANQKQVANPAAPTGKGQLHRDFGVPGSFRAWERFHLLGPRRPAGSNRGANRSLSPYGNFGIGGVGGIGCGHRFNRLACGGCGGMYAPLPPGYVQKGQVGGANGYILPTSAASDVGVAPFELQGNIASQAQRSLDEYLFFITGAEQAFQSGNYASAAQNYLLACELNQADPTAYLGAAQALVATGRYPQAGKRLRRALDLQPKIANFPIDLRSAYGKRTDFESHLQQLQQSTEDSENPLQWFLLAFYLHNSGAPGLAEDILGFARMLAPEDRVIGRYQSAVMGN